MFSFILLKESKKIIVTITNMKINIIFAEVKDQNNRNIN